MNHHTTAAEGGRSAGRGEGEEGRVGGEKGGVTYLPPSEGRARGETGGCLTGVSPSYTVPGPLRAQEG